MNPVIETRGLTHRFGGETVLSGLELAVPAGSIYGLLGANGAGKTTTMRLLLGLLQRQHGTIEIFGKNLEHDRVAILRRVGSSIESPSLYGHLTAFENLEVWRRIFRCDRRRIPEVLSLVDLAATGAKRAEQFSLGMRQRLAIAVALLHQPSLLVLDEPTNGLDPHGILDMRRLLTELNRNHGITILVSSHILSEIERVATHVGILHRGHLRFQGTLDELRARQASASFTVVDTDDPERTVAIGRAEGFTGRVVDGRVVFPPISREAAGALNAKIVASGVALYAASTVQGDLEHIFLDMVGDRAC